MKIQRLLSYVRCAVDDYNMIEAGDRIAIGVSGGKDSLALIAALSTLRRFYPKPFELEAISVDLGFEGMDFSPVEAYCREYNVNYTIVHTDIGEIIFKERREKNPCSLCAKMRKGALNDMVEKLGSNKIALGHNKDDVVETMLMSLFYEGRISCFSPVTYLDRKKITSIRPLIYAPESDVKGFARRYSLPVVKNLCPADGNTKREEMKEMVREYRKKFDCFDSKIFGAIQRAGINGWKLSDSNPRRSSAENTNDKG